MRNLIPSYILSEYCLNGNISNGSSNCTDISSIPNTAYPVNKDIGIVPYIPQNGYNANGKQKLLHINNKRDECLVNPVGNGVFNIRSQLNNDINNSWTCISNSLINKIEDAVNTVQTR